MALSKKRVAAIALTTIQHRVDRIALKREQAGDIAGAQLADRMGAKITKAMDETDAIEEMSKGELSDILEQLVGAEEGVHEIIEEALGGEEDEALDESEDLHNEPPKEGDEENIQVEEEPGGDVEFEFAPEASTTKAGKTPASKTARRRYKVSVVG